MKFIVKCVGCSTKKEIEATKEQPFCELCGCPMILEKVKK